MKQDNKNDDISVYNDAYSFWDNKKCAKQRAIKGYCYRDLYAIDMWFLNTIPNMLSELVKRGNKIGYPNQIAKQFYQVNKDRIPVSEKEFVYGCLSDKHSDLIEESSNWCNKKWIEILNRMIFLFTECQIDKCSLKNKYQEEYNKANIEFCNKYGIYGEKLNKAGCYDCHNMEELPEYKEISKHYQTECKKIVAYRQECKNEALKLFVKYFDDLWW